MRGSDMRTGELFSYVDLEKRVPSDHRLRLIRRIVNKVLATLDREFAELYAAQGDRRSRRSGCCGRFCCRRVLHHRQLLEQLHYNLLYRWFVGLGVDDPVWVPTVFTKNRNAMQGPRLLAELIN
jgi:transposase